MSHCVSKYVGDYLCCVGGERCLFGLLSTIIFVNSQYVNYSVIKVILTPVYLHPTTTSFLLANFAEDNL